MEPDHAALRILLVSHFYWPEVGPPQLRWGALVRHLVEEGHVVHVVAPFPHFPVGQALPGYEEYKRGAVERGPHGEHVHRLRFLTASASPRSVMLDQLVVAGATLTHAVRRRAEIAPDVVVASAPALATLMAGWLIGTVLRRPVVMELRDAWPDLMDVFDGDSRPSRWPVRGLLRATVVGMTALQRGADHVVTTTDAFAATLRSRGVGRVTTIRNAWHPFGGSPAAAPSVRTADRLRIVYVGSIGRAQGLETAVRALALVQQAGVAAAMTLVGTGTAEASVRELAHSLKVDVTMVGAQPRDEVLQYFRDADTLLVIHRGWRALAQAVPSKLYEALALGIHVSGVVRGEAAAIISETCAGFVSPPEDPVSLAAEWIRLGRDRDELLVDAQAMSAWVAEHADEKATARAYSRLLQRVVTERGRQR